MKDKENLVPKLIADNFRLNGLIFNKEIAEQMYDEIRKETLALEIVSSIKSKAIGKRKAYFTYIKSKTKVIVLNNTL